MVNLSNLDLVYGEVLPATRAITKQTPYFNFIDFLTFLYTIGLIVFQLDLLFNYFH